MNLFVTTTKNCVISAFRMYLELELRDAITEEGCSIFTVIFALSAFDKLAKEHRLNKYHGSEHSHPKYN